MTENPLINLLVVLGPTASGKTRLGVALARRLGGEIISADSRQVFHGMDLGTGKDLCEYGDLPYHLIDVAEPGTEFSVFAFQRAFYAAFTQILSRSRLPVLVGGTGLYLDAVLRGYHLVAVPENPVLRGELAVLSDEQLQERLLRIKPALHNTTDLQERERLLRAIEIADGEVSAGGDLPARPLLHPLVFGVRWERTELRRRIATRLQERLALGLMDEVQNLYESGVPWERLEYYGLEYRFIARYLQGLMTYDDMVQQLAVAIGQFAKRQETFFRRMERQGIEVHWVDGQRDPLSQVLRLLESVALP